MENTLNSGCLPQVRELEWRVTMRLHLRVLKRGPLHYFNPREVFEKGGHYVQLQRLEQRRVHNINSMLEPNLLRFIICRLYILSLSHHIC